MRGCMIWIGLATTVVVFVVGFRVLTSDSRRAIRRLSERLGITPVPLESMIDQLGKKPPVMSICVTRSGRMKHICRMPRRCCSSGRSRLSTPAKKTCITGIA